MSDLIDRDETIKQFCKQDCGCDPRDCPDKICYEVEIIESVPTHTTPSNTLGALDCVSREDLTKGIETYFGDLPIAVHYDMLALAQRLPPVQPRKGKWIYGEHDVSMCDGYRCDKCGFFVPWDYQHKFIDFIKDYNYCPSCGADMRGRGDSVDR